MRDRERDRQERTRDDDAAFERLFAPLRDRQTRLPPGFRQAVMRRVRERPASAPVRAWRWIATPRTFALRPATVALALAAALAVAVLTRPEMPGGDPGTGATVTAGLEVPVRLVFVAPEAGRVAVTGDFAAWSPDGIPMMPVGDGRWVAELQLAPGAHHYVFVVDGTEWRPDPNATSQVDDGFGQQNSVLLVPEPRSS